MDWIRKPYLGILKDQKVEESQITKQRQENLYSFGAEAKIFKQTTNLSDQESLSYLLVFHVYPQSYVY